MNDNLMYKEYFRKHGDNNIRTLKNAFILIGYLILIGLLLAMMLGIKVYCVVGWSMQPKIDYESIVFVNTNQDNQSYKVGDILTFNFGTAVNTHRIIEIHYNTPGVASSGVDYYETQGDNPELTTIEHIKPEKIIGKVIVINDLIFTIPRLGATIQYIQKNIASVVVVLIAGYIFFVSTPKRSKYTNYKA